VQAPKCARLNKPYLNIMDIDVLKMRAHLTRHIHTPVVDFYIIEYLYDINKDLGDAAYCGYLDTVKYLISIGADVHNKDNYAVRWAARYGHLDTVKYLVFNGANIHSLDDAAICWAAGMGHLDTVKYLVSVGADVHVQNDWAIRFAALDNYVDVVNYLKSIK